MTEHDPFDLKAQDQRREEREKALLAEFRIAADDLRWLASGKRGRRFLWRLIDGVDEDPYAASHGEMCRRTGEQKLSRGLRKNMLLLCPERFLQMLQENQDG